MVQGTGQDRALLLLPTHECRRLLATRQFGRIGLAGGHYPMILPVNHVLDGDAIVLRTASPKIITAGGYARVAFEVDGVDERTRSGWSVLLHALAQEVTGAARDKPAARLRAADGVPRAPGEHGHGIRLIPKAVTGRRIVPGQLPSAFEEGAHL